jgi:integration host factor subunit alpha
VLDEICDAIVRGETVKLSSFATFQIRDKNERIGRNPKTGEEVPILPRRVMTFKASNVLKQKILHTHQQIGTKQPTEASSSR